MYEILEQKMQEITMVHSEPEPLFQRFLSRNMENVSGFIYNLSISHCQKYKQINDI